MLTNDVDIQVIADRVRSAARSKLKGFIAVGSSLTKQSFTQLLRKASALLREAGHNDVKTIWPRQLDRPIASMEANTARVLALEIIDGICSIKIGGLPAALCREFQAALQQVTRRAGFSLPWPVQVTIPVGCQGVF